MTLQRILPFTRTLLDSVLEKGSIAIDGTCGNGHDTLYLAERVGEEGKVYGYDIQEEALLATKARLEKEGHLSQVNLIHSSHAHVLDTIEETDKGQVAAAIFNLGYLPGGDKSIVTNPKDTLEAVSSILELLKPGGLLIVVVYSGHPEGKKESDAVLKFTSELDQRDYQVLRYGFINQKNNPPYVLAISKT